MYAASPRVEHELLAKISRLDDPDAPIAETYRRARSLADELGVPRPSYEWIRQHLIAERRRKRRRKQKRDLLLDVAYRARPVEALAELYTDP